MTNIFIPKKGGTCNQTVEQYNPKITTKKDRREDKGRVLAISRNVYHLLNSDTVYYVESESGDNVYYFVKFKPEVLQESSLWYCNCKDNSTRHSKCKHLWAIEFAIKWGTIKDIELPIEARQQQQYPPQQTSVIVVQPSKSYLEDDYDF